MVNRSFPAPSSISEVARRFIDEAVPLESLNTGLEALTAKRRELHSLYSPPGLDVQKTLGVIVEEGEIDGVNVKWVRPEMIRHPQVILYFFGGGHITGSQKILPSRRELRNSLVVKSAFRHIGLHQKTPTRQH